MAYQSLYRRYRPQKFADIRGQEHVVKALRNAVRDDRVGHAYLLSGPRGTGKTTAARVLAKVLNCTNISDGEPCGECESCVSIENGTSFDLHELDAASNNKVDDIRDLLSKVALGTPGRTKVYLLDEVHMLTAGAENALLKTLEEPPDHVVFVLATTEPHKVVPTIRSRTQHLQLSLIPSEQMLELVREVAADAGLELDAEAIDYVVKVGGGSARDTLSALDQVVAAGGVAEADGSTTELLESLATTDAGRAVAAIEAATTLGIDPRRIGERFIDALRSAFLVRMGSAPARLSESELASATEYASRLSPATMTRSLEAIGRSLVDMRQAPDPRIDLEVAFVRITQPSAGGSDTEDLLGRIEALESALAAGTTPSTPAAPAPTTPAPTETVPASDETPASVEATAAADEPNDLPPKGSRPADRARAALKPRGGDSARAPAPAPVTASPTAPAARGSDSSAPMPPSMRRAADDATPAPEPVASAEPVDEPSAEATQAEAVPAPAEAEPAPAGVVTVTFDVVRDGWGPLLDGQATKIRARFLAGTVTGVDDGVVFLSFPTAAQIDRCRPFAAQVEAALTDSFGVPLTIDLATGDAPASPSGAAAKPSAALPTDDEVDVHDLTDADGQASTVVDRIADVFPGAEVLPSNES